jgi:hypothetical protein
MKTMVEPVDRTLLFGKCVCLLLGFMLFAFEWHYAKGAEIYQVGRILSYPTYLLGPMLLFWVMISGLDRGAPRIRQYKINLLLLYSGTIAATYLQYWFPTAFSMEINRYDMSELIMLPAWGIFGIILGRRVEAAYRVLTWFARGCAVGCLISVLLGLLLGNDRAGFLCRAGWPMRLVFLFGFCWYLSSWLVGKHFWHWSLAGLLACMLEVWFTLQKPIIFAMGFAVVTILWLCQRAMPARARRDLKPKVLSLLAVVVVVYGVVDVRTGGSATEAVKTFWYVRVLHQGSGFREIGETKEELARAAGGRFPIWTEALRRLGASPLIGSGYQSVEVEAGEVSLHNGYLDWLLAFGMLGAIPMLVMCAVWFRRILRYGSDLSHEFEIIIVTAVGGYVVGMAAYNLGGTSRVFYNVSYFLALVAGIAFRLAVDPAARMQPRGPDWRMRPRRGL